MGVAMSGITVFQAAKIITMDPNRPTATHVAVRDGHVLAVGDATCADRWGRVRHDNRLAGTILMPGFVEGHSHMSETCFWDYTYVGFHDRVDPDGQPWPGVTEIGAVLARLRDAAAQLPADAPLIAWGFDPIFLSSARLTRDHLDSVAADRPVVVLFSSGHLMCVNSAALAAVGYDRASNVEGIQLRPDGEPNGELHEMAAMFPVMRRIGMDFRTRSHQRTYVDAFGRICRRSGVTTATDLFAMVTQEGAEALAAATARPDYPVRIVPAVSTLHSTPEEVRARMSDLHQVNHDKLRFGPVKLMTDGSIQGFSARILWPGYVGGQPNGIWNMPPAEIHATCAMMQQAGIQMHIHTNGDEASTVVLDALSAAARAHPWPGARHVLQHAQMMGPALFARAAELGVCVNLFANHIWYFGDQHAALTIGPDRAARMDACRAALDAGLTMAIHSDAPVTPMGPLFTAWCAVNRQTMSGRTLGAAQCISVPEALYAITMGAARTLKLEAEIGSIETGKRADFAVLADDPLAIDPMRLKDLPVLGTVIGGHLDALI